MQKEINKFLKKIHVEKLRNNHKECIELYNIVGGLYSDIGSYDEAIHYHEQSLEVCKKIGDRLGTAMAFRYIGEAKGAIGNFYQAIEYIKKYLELAQRIDNKVEIQRAWTTLGRIYLMQAQDLKEKNNIIDDKIRDIAREAEKKLQTALSLAESVRDRVDDKEFAQMRSSLFVNLGLVNETCDRHNESVSSLNKAVEICRCAKLKEDLYRCLIILAGIYRQRGNLKMAVRTSEEALATAKHIGRKILICDALIERGLVKILQRDFKNAKRTFAQAYLEKSPSEEDHLKAIRLTKLTHLICSNYEKLNEEGGTSDSKLKLCDKLGDLFVAVNAYRLAIEFYKRAFADAKLCSKPRSELARILYSIAETYADDKQFQHALVCYEKELVYRNGNDTEQCQSLIKIAHMNEYLAKEPSKVADAYEKALDKAGKDPKLMYFVLKDYVAYLSNKSFNMRRHRELEGILLNLKSFPDVMSEVDKEDLEDANDLEDEIANVDDIITDDEGNDEVMMIGRKRSRGATKFKPNEVGDTPLHEACIKGDLKRVKSLISQGHEINPRDNAGWIPLHEACNHGHYEIVEYLIENGADVNNRGLKGMSPLHDAATNGHYGIVRLLISNGANVIALTDTGETVLSCLRDHKRRNYSDMSNSDLSEYKQMESELLNAMDKCGYNLMAENIKNLGHERKTTSDALETVDRPKQASGLNDYRSVIGSLKRKRTEDLGDRGEKPNLPATFRTVKNTSIPTKKWIVLDSSSDSEQEMEPQVELESQPNLPMSSPVRQSSRVPVQDKVEVIDLNEKDMSDFDAYEMATFSPNQSNNSIIFSPETSSSSNRPQDQNFNGPSSEQSHPSSHFHIFQHPLKVIIGDKKILIPIKDEYLSIKSLKETIVDRYSILMNAKPVISLAPISDPSCILFDGDLCKDVVSEDIVAIIESWELNSMEDTYLNGCRKLNITPLSSIKLLLKRINESEHKLDLSYTRIPRTHLEAINETLLYRDFNIADLSGSTSLFDCQQSAMKMLNSIFTWRMLSCLSLKCVGLTQIQFDIMCNKMKLDKLKSLDVSFNSIIIRNKMEYKTNIEKLRQSCISLRRLDMRGNVLQFELLASEFGCLEILSADQFECILYS